jgi:hypothetical protein
MDVAPDFRATRFSQLKPGELFLVSIDSRYEVALAAADPYEGDMVPVLLGPGRDRAGRIPRGIQANVLSLGTEYELRLPAAPSGWSADEPVTDQLCFALGAYGREGSEQTLFLRAMFDVPPHGHLRCYVDVRSGQILADREQRAPYIAPNGICSYAIEWSLFTKEKKPRLILRYPPGDPAVERSGA